MRKPLLKTRKHHKTSRHRIKNPEALAVEAKCLERKILKKQKRGNHGD